MKHTDFHSIIRKIKEQERRELINAVIAHGGHYEWEDEGEKPIIAANVKHWEDPIDVYITHVYIIDGSLRIYGEAKESGTPVEIDSYDAFAGHISYIIDMIPETESIKEVSSESGIVFWNNKKYMKVPERTCKNCAFENEDCLRGVLKEITMDCVKEDIIFKEVE